MSGPGTPTAPRSGATSVHRCQFVQFSTKGGGARLSSQIPLRFNHRELNPGHALIKGTSSARPGLRARDVARAERAAAKSPRRPDASAVDERTARIGGTFRLPSDVGNVTFGEMGASAVRSGRDSSGDNSARNAPRNSPVHTIERAASELDAFSLWRWDSPRRRTVSRLRQRRGEASRDIAQRRRVAAGQR